MRTRANEYIQKMKPLFLHPTVQSIGLNTVRVLSLASLTLVFLSTIVDMDINVKALNAFYSSFAKDRHRDHDIESALVNCEYIEGSSVPNQPAGAFCAFMASLLILFQTIVLALSELGWYTSLFDRYFPVLGSNFGLGILGVFQCMISTQILSHFVEDFTLVSAFFLFIFGFLNILLGLIFRESAKSKRSINSWGAKINSVLPTFRCNRPFFVNKNPPVISNPREITPRVVRLDLTASHDGSESWRDTEKVQYGFGKQGEESAALRGILQKPAESLPAPFTISPFTLRSPPTSRSPLTSRSSPNSGVRSRPNPF